MSKKILIVDDEPFIRTLLVQTLEDLEDQGVELLTAGDGVDAWEIAQQEHPERRSKAGIQWDFDHEEPMRNDSEHERPEMEKRWHHDHVCVVEGLGVTRFGHFTPPGGLGAQPRTTALTPSAKTQPPPPEDHHASIGTSGWASAAAPCWAAHLNPRSRRRPCEAS